MFRPKSPQPTLFRTSMLLTDKMLERIKSTWAWLFRTRALPLINEELFRDLFDDDNGRPNKPVQTLVGIHILKDMRDLTDDEALEALEFNLMWHVALDLEPGEAHTCQKTLHSFRAKLLENDRVRLLFTSMTDQILQALGIDTGKQRLDSSHIVSNIARLRRLGLFCETIRVFLRDLQSLFPALLETVPQGLRARYLNDGGVPTRYEDAKSSEAQRRLSVAARDVWRLVTRFEEKVVGLESYLLLERLLGDQCKIVKDPPAPKPDDPDAGDPPAPVVVKDAEEVRSSSLQSPHDPGVTYSGHKGKGYEVQVAETCGNEEKPEIITYVEVTPSCASDEAAMMPAVEALNERNLRPDELLADTTFASTANVIECAKLGTELVGPAGGTTKALPTAVDGALSKADFQVDPAGERRTRCPAGFEATSEERRVDGTRIHAVFDASLCEKCDQRDRCPTKSRRDGTRVFDTTLHAAVLDQRRRYERTDAFAERYAERAGIEATNSELKRAHGLGKLRVRGQARVRLAVYLKALACNVKRMLKHLVEQARRAARAVLDAHGELQTA